MHYRGLTWDHPRGYTALAAASAGLSDDTLEWDRHPLEGFEAHPIADLCVLQVRVAEQFAIGTDGSLSSQLYLWTNHGIGPDGDVGLDQNACGIEKGHPGVHVSADRPLAQDSLQPGQIGP